MWIFTPRGFYSVVEKPQDKGKGTLTVRTRNRADIDALVELIPDAKPYRVGYSDYAWRIRCSRGEWMGALVVMADEIRYSNFKDEVKAKQGKTRANVYMRVWSAMLAIRDPEKRRGRVAGSRDFAQGVFTQQELDDWRAGR